jgi:hypothetical protein
MISVNVAGYTGVTTFSPSPRAIVAWRSSQVKRRIDHQVSVRFTPGKPH